MSLHSVYTTCHDMNEMRWSDTALRHGAEPGPPVFSRSVLTSFTSFHRSNECKEIRTVGRPFRPLRVREPGPPLHGRSPPSHGRHSTTLRSSRSPTAHARCAANVERVRRGKSGERADDRRDERRLPRSFVSRHPFSYLGLTALSSRRRSCSGPPYGRASCLRRVVIERQRIVRHIRLSSTKGPHYKGAAQP